VNDRSEQTNERWSKEAAEPKARGWPLPPRNKGDKVGSKKSARVLVLRGQRYQQTFQNH